MKSTVIKMIAGLPVCLLLLSTAVLAQNDGQGEVVTTNLNEGKNFKSEVATDGQADIEPVLQSTSYGVSINSSGVASDELEPSSKEATQRTVRSFESLDARKAEIKRINEEQSIGKGDVDVQRLNDRNARIGEFKSQQIGNQPSVQDSEDRKRISEERKNRAAQNQSTPK